LPAELFTLPFEKVLIWLFYEFIKHGSRPCRFPFSRHAAAPVIDGRAMSMGRTFLPEEEIMETDHPSEETFGTYSRQQDQIRQIIYQIRRLMQAGYHYTKELNKTYQVSAPQLNCLLALHEKGPLPPSQIARQIMLKSSTLTGVIDRLESKGFVKRTRTSPDRRVIMIELTESGRVLAQHAPPPIQQTIVDGLKQLPSHQLDQIIENLGLLTKMLNIQKFDSEHSEEYQHPI